MSGDAVLLRSRVSLIGNTFSKNMSLLSDEDRARIEREALQEVSAHCSPKAVSFVRYFLTAGTEADFSDVLAFCTDQKDEEIVNFHLALDNLLLMVNRRLIKPLIQRNTNGRYSFLESNIFCTGDFAEGGYFEFLYNKQHCRVSLCCSEMEWSNVCFRKDDSTVFRNAKFCADRDPFHMLAYFNYSNVLYGLHESSEKDGDVRSYSTVVLFGCDPRSDNACVFLLNEKALLSGVANKRVLGADLTQDQISMSDSWKYLMKLQILDAVIATDKGNGVVKDMSLPEAFAWAIREGWRVSRIYDIELGTDV